MRADFRLRFIPAGAGNTLQLRSLFPQSSVYPRWRGEHLIVKIKKQAESGLSPLARGTRAKVQHYHHIRRFIPAGAGNTMFPAPKCDRQAVYPRWRGEHNDKLSVTAITIGLSPLARGTPCVVDHDFRDNRFIPAGAGNTFFFGAQPQPNAVYPRWRGEHL
ncbi:hypothetical protein SEENP078_15106 [Salmonella enterica subsp. enterica serovar Newport str. RI_10P078]|nr:hypothetical protein SEENP078_15106 [Salmonella enterica subsp. enterica serovar Newport str. RI_10P078]ESC45839.1 hypothetical protein SEENP079_06844 [Salmonella enterica subsp. enterica serovar Newport str. RI_10P079]ESC51557.1 hypothetical protein SEENP069_17244 [Salmonella enterica subsp. enterica serovar Newport str. RI_10P069]ESC75268.1 hypothetical protein SEEN4881_16703 [Salmonella enterica subsp. enterica serovar Newport str. WA_14881]ESC79603.1 hypothetical protein SEEN2572_09408 [